MANIKEHYLSELRIYSPFAEDALSASLHSLMYVRAPTISTAQERSCSQLSPLIYTSVGLPDVDRHIKDIIGQLLRQATTAKRSSYRSGISLSFFVKHEIKEWMGLVNRSENVYVETWYLPITVLNSPTLNALANTNGSGGQGNNLSAVPNRRHSTGSQASSGEEEISYQQAHLQAYDQTNKTILAILETVNQFTDHMPLVLYDYELQVTDVDSERRRSTIRSSVALQGLI